MKFLSAIAFWFASSIAAIALSGLYEILNRETETAATRAARQQPQALVAVTKPGLRPSSYQG
ncbi:MULTISPECIES: hypothetical protein [unclassified Cupriavidus]|uniref:hypothetical protein n=1 Tax=unclassified Cupriavidus TaxID=2640874 RepID=UPI000B0A3E8D|nr:hypothetical protein [Cupriavidus sp. YR651]